MLAVVPGPSDIIPAARLARGARIAATGDEPAAARAWENRPLLGAAGQARQKLVYLETYGCQMNVADSDMMMALLAGAGWRRTLAPDEADVLLINTCAVRERAEQRVVARARELGSHKKNRQGVLLAITGCMAEHLKGELVERIPLVDLVAGPDSYRRLPQLIDSARLRGESPLLDVRLDRGETYEGLSGADGGDGVSGFISIQRGCDKFCTFCVVPFTRGRERGTPPREILRQARDFAERGYREVVLLGQTVNSYRYQDVGFADLLRAVAAVDGLERIRFTSPYPIDFTDEVIEVVAGEAKVCKHVHLPLQSGSDRILARMRRGYEVGDFCRVLARLRAAVPGIALSTDVMTGFCGETEEDHAATLALLREIRFDSAFTFLYSERDLTFAGKKLADDVPPEVKRRRIQEIIAQQEAISARIYADHIGRRERVLLHAPSKRSPDQPVGRTDGFKAVILPPGSGQPGDFVEVEIHGSTMATLFGRPTSSLRPAG